VPEELTLPEIAGIVEAFGDAAGRAVLAGFDLVEIHGAHGYLITNFLSPHTNKRTDHYGGSLENRMRFLVQVIRNIRAKVPAGFPVTLRISGSDYEPDGITIEETVEVCRAVEALGLDAIHVSGGDHQTMIYQVSPMLIPRGLHVAAAEAVKHAVSVPVIASGSLTLPEIAEQVLASGKADFVSLGRPLLTDPDWPRKAKHGRADEIRPCIRCNDGCLDRSLFKFRSVACSVNPLLGFEGRLEVEPAPAPRRLAVVGGGPAGLEAARVLALRGHQVTLYEQHKLGGLLNQASAPSFKSDLRPYLDYLIGQAEKLGVQIHQQKATPDTINQAGYDAVVVATGGQPRPLQLPGDSTAIPALELDPAQTAGSTVVVIGAGLTGTETALTLAETGATSITLVEAEAEIMRGDPITDQISYRQHLHHHNITLLTNSKAVELHTDHVLLADGRQLPAQHTIAAIGTLPNPTLASQLRNQNAPDTHLIGNAAQPGRIHDAIHSAYHTARAI